VRASGCLPPHLALPFLVRLDAHGIESLADAADPELCDDALLAQAGVDGEEAARFRKIMASNGTLL